MSINFTQNTLFNNLSPTFKNLLTSPCNYYELPIELWQMILEYLSPSDLYNLTLYNKSLFISNVIYEFN